MKRLRARDPHLSEEEARDRVGSQMPVREKVGRTENRGLGRGVVVWNEGEKEELRERLGEVVEGLRGVGLKGWTGEVKRWWLWGSPFGVVGVGGWEMWKSWRARVEWEKRRGKELEERKEGVAERRLEKGKL